jgi:hypothetical protein
VRERLKQQAIVLAHPDLDQHYPELKTYQHDYTERQHSRYTQDTRWIVYYASSSPTGKKSSRLIWTPTGKQTWNQFTDAEIKPIESQLEPHVKPLRVILAEEVVEKHLTRIAREIRQRSEKLGLFTSQATQKPPDGSKVWAAFQKERQRFDAYTTRWQDQVAALLTLDQVFIVS